MTRWALAIALATCGACRTGPGPPTPKTTADTNSSPNDRRAEIEACIHGLYRPLETAHYVEGCANLWLEPGCREAWSASMEQPAGQRGEHVIQGCADAYCPALDPQPVLCTQRGKPDLLSSDPDWMALWTDFNAITLSRDLGLPDGDQRGALIARRLLQSVAMSGSESSTDGS